LIVVKQSVNIGLSVNDRRAPSTVRALKLSHGPARFGEKERSPDEQHTVPPRDSAALCALPLPALRFILHLNHSGVNDYVWPVFIQSPGCASNHSVGLDPGQEYDAPAHGNTDRYDHAYARRFFRAVERFQP
jgi:hypothetical protein